MPLSGRMRPKLTMRPDSRAVAGRPGMFDPMGMTLDRVRIHGAQRSACLRSNSLVNTRWRVRNMNGPSETLPHIAPYWLPPCVVTMACSRFASSWGA